LRNRVWNRATWKP